jgi:hypothetical protein
MAKEESHWYAFTHAKCPHCHHGEMFVNRNPYAIMSMSKMPSHCALCGRSFFPETGFYWGAMYMSYVMTVMFSAVNVVMIGFIFGWDMCLLIGGNTLLLIGSFPLFYRYARVLWLQLNTPFSPEAFEKTKAPGD